MTGNVHRRTIQVVFCVLVTGMLVGFGVLIREMLEVGKFFFFEGYFDFSRFTFSVKKEYVGLLRVRLLSVLSLQVMGVIFAGFLLKKASLHWHEPYRFYIFLFFVSYQAHFLEVWNWVLVLSQAPGETIVFIHRSALLMRICGDVFLFIATAYCYGIQQKSYGMLSLVLILVLGRFLTFLSIDLTQLNLIHPYDLRKIWSIDVISLLVTIVTICAYIQLTIRGKGRPVKRWWYGVCIILMMLSRQALMYARHMGTVIIAVGVMIIIAPSIYSLLISLPFFSRVPPQVQQ